MTSKVFTPAVSEQLLGVRESLLTDCTLWVISLSVSGEAWSSTEPSLTKLKTLKTETAILAVAFSPGVSL